MEVGRAASHKLVGFGSNPDRKAVMKGKDGKEITHKIVDEAIVNFREMDKARFQKKFTEEELAYKAKKKKIVLFPWLSGSKRVAAIERMNKKYGI